MLIVLLAPVGVLFVLAVVLLAFSPGRPSPIVDERGHPVVGSISEKIHVDINGAEQGMFIRGRDETNPVLLYVHGGAGMPEYFLYQRYPEALEALEEQFTVCWWERRGAGLSYSPGISPEAMSIEQMVSDTIAVTDYLRDRFQQQKIYVMAHSGGTFFALQAVARSPQSYHAYIAVGQIAYQLRSENVAYEHLLKRYQEIGDAGMIRRLESAHSPMLEEPERMRQIIEQDVFGGTNSLADRM